MSVIVPPIGHAVTLRGTHAAARASVREVFAPHVRRFFVTLWSVIAVAIPLSFYVSTRIGAPAMHPNEYPFNAAIYLLWVPLVPLLVYLARRFAPTPGRRLRVALVHLGVALPIIFAKLIAHRLVFCAGFNAPYWGCVCGIRFESWLAAWYLYELFVYGATVAGTWAFDAIERTHQREMAVAEKERELSAAELQAQYGHIAPSELTALFGAISAKIREDAGDAEQMITRVADFLRLTVQRMRNEP